MTPSTQEQTNQTKNKKFLKIFGIIVGAIVLVIIIASISTGGNDETETADDTQQVEQQEHADPLDAIASATSDDATAELNGINLEVSFPLSTNVTKGMLGATARQRTTDALQAIQEHGDDIDEDWERIIIRGHQEDREIMSPVYDPDVIADTNFDNFNPANVWDLRDHGLVHPDLEDN